MNVPDLITTVAYFSIPVQILISLWKFPRLAHMPLKTTILLVLFALFIFLCGTGHLMRCMGQTETQVFYVINWATAIVSMVTALYLLPLIPSLLGSLDESLQELVKMNKETAESKSKLFTFMAFLCHEIRNPLFAITSSVSFLGDTDLTEEQVVGVGSIFDSSLLMLRLVNDVLDLSKIDAGKLELEERDFDLHRLLENLENNMRMQIRQKHRDAVQLQFRMAPEVPRIIHGDSTRVLQIVYNLLSNSNKFTSDGNIGLEVAVCDEAEALRAGIHLPTKEEEEDTFGDEMFSMALLDAAEKGQIEMGAVSGKDSNNPSREMVMLSITVTDTGIGIAPDRIGTIFEPYSQAKLSDYRRHGGTGLGLSIISSLAQIMGGTVQASSTLGEGSKFVLYLSVGVAANQSKKIVDDAIADMSDPFLSSRRLPVYKMEEKESSIEISGTSLAKKAPEALHSDEAGVQFFAGQPSFESQSAPEPKLKKKKEKKPSLAKFVLPKGFCMALVVDDNCVNRKILGKMLKFYDIQYEEAVDGLEAVNAIKMSRNVTGDSSAPHFGIIFMDLSMPVMDGYEAIENIRKMGIAVPIIALTANALSQERKRALGAGANEFHTKPILRQDLHAICTRYLHPPQGLEPAPAAEGESVNKESFANGASQGRPLQEASCANGVKSMGDTYREELSLMLRHDSAVGNDTTEIEIV